MIVITDLDGCLLDARTYSWEAHRETLADLKRRAVPVVFCTSKTRAETEALRREMGNDDPFIVESGGAVVLRDRTIVLGTPYPEVLFAFDQLKAATGARGFSDMTPEEIAADCGLTIERVRLAKQREYDEPFRCAVDPTAQAVALGFRCSKGGRYWHLHGDTDKGKAVRALLRAAGGGPTVGIGDSMLDLHLLEATDVRCAIARPDGTHDEVLEANFPDLRRFSNWSEAILGTVLSP
ncbi:MAG: HAD-IIB family hydrolase [Planctomycetes bacterium]|nr:HAD-IIB family hydrolase [Planctomycetota bacterium]